MKTKICGTRFGCNKEFPATNEFFKITDGELSAKCISCITKRSIAKSEMSSEEIAVDRRLTRDHYGSIIQAELKRRLTLDPSSYETILEIQDNKCAICENYESKTNSKGSVIKLCADHNHITNEFRGLLCHKCNTAIGLLGFDEFSKFETFMKNIRGYLTKVLRCYTRVRIYTIIRSLINKLL